MLALLDYVAECTYSIAVASGLVVAGLIDTAMQAAKKSGCFTVLTCKIKVTR